MDLFEDAEEHDNTLPLPHDSRYWAAILRGQLIAANIQKLTSYVALADQKAQAMIIINSILIPVSMNWITEPDFRVPVTIAVFTALVSILAAILCIYPKRRRGNKPDGTRNLFHFGDIGRMKEDEYLKAFHPIFNDLSRLSQEAIKDLHDVSRRIIIPKFFWLKVSYGCFFVGNVIAVIYAITTIFSAG